MTLRAIRTAVALLSATAVAVLPAGPAQADRIRNDQWHLRYLNVAEAHKISQGEGVTVAVIDTGVDPHPDLVKNLLPGTDLFQGGSGDGRKDTDSHGTAMAGLIAAHGQGASSGALGIAPRAKILPIRYRGEKTSGSSDALALGINAAVQKGAKVISISLGGGPTPELRKAVEHAAAADVVVVAAAGNKPVDFGITFPAFLDGVVAVGASDSHGNKAEISVTGSQLAIVAPGTDIYSTSINGKYWRGEGTSPSTAIVAGAAALVRSKYPDLSAKEVVHRLTATAVDKGAPGRDEEYGYGVVDLVAALTANVPPLQTATPGTDPSPSATGSVAAPNTDPSGSSTGTLLLALSVLLIIALAVGVLVVLSHRRRVTAAGGSGTAGSGTAGGTTAGSSGTAGGSGRAVSGGTAAGGGSAGDVAGGGAGG